MSAFLDDCIKFLTIYSGRLLDEIKNDGQSSQERSGFVRIDDDITLRETTCRTTKWERRDGDSTETSTFAQAFNVEYPSGKDDLYDKQALTERFLEKVTVPGCRYDEMEFWFKFPYPDGDDLTYYYKLVKSDESGNSYTVSEKRISSVYGAEYVHCDEEMLKFDSDRNSYAYVHCARYALEFEPVNEQSANEGNDACVPVCDASDGNMTDEIPNDDLFADDNFCGTDDADLFDCDGDIIVNDNYDSAKNTTAKRLLEEWYRDSSLKLCKEQSDSAETAVERLRVKETVYLCNLVDRVIANKQYTYAKESGRPCIRFTYSDMAIFDTEKRMPEICNVDCNLLCTYINDAFGFAATLYERDYDFVNCRTPEKYSYVFYCYLQ